MTFKKVFLSVIFMSLVMWGFSQPVQLNVRFENAVVTPGTPDVLEFDVYVKASQALTEYYTMQFGLDYNTAAFGSSIASSVTTTLNPIWPFPTYFSTGNTNQGTSSLMLGVITFLGPPHSYGMFVEVSSTAYVPVLHYQISIVDNTELAGIQFNSAYMATQNTYLSAGNPTAPGLAYSLVYDNDLLTFPLGSSLGPPELIISEVADPKAPDDDARFVEIYNPSASEYNFSSWNIWLNREVNGGPTIHSVKLTGTLPAGGTYVVAADGTAFTAAYGSSADLVNANVASGDGNDGYFLTAGADLNTETPFDAFGVPSTSGSGTGWEYTDTKAVRKYGITAPNPTFTASEWVVGPKDPSNPGTGILVSYAGDMTPGSHRADLEWVGGSSTSWRDRNNWSPSYVPDAAHNAFVPSPGSMIVNDTTYGYCNNLNLTDPPAGPGAGGQSNGTDNTGGIIIPIGETISSGKLEE